MRKTSSPAELEAHLGYWLRMVSNAVSQGFARKVEAEGVTVAEWVVLRVLFDEDRIAPTVLAARIGMTKGAISKLADRLIEKGLVARDVNAEDKRAQILVLKPAGRKRVPRLAELADRNDVESFGALSPAERRELERLLRKIASDRALKDIPTD